MIVDFLMKGVIGLLTGVLDLVPSYSLPDSVTGAGATIGGGIGQIDGIIPVVTIGLCLAVILAFRLFLFAWSIIVFVYDRFPLKAT